MPNPNSFYMHYGNYEDLITQTHTSAAGKMENVTGFQAMVHQVTGADWLDENARVATDGVRLHVNHVEDNSLAETNFANKSGQGLDMGQELGQRTAVSVEALRSL